MAHPADCRPQSCYCWIIQTFIFLYFSLWIFFALSSECLLGLCSWQFNFWLLRIREFECGLSCVTCFERWCAFALRFYGFQRRLFSCFLQLVFTFGSGLMFIFVRFSCLLYWRLSSTLALQNFWYSCWATQNSYFPYSLSTISEFLLALAPSSSLVLSWPLCQRKVYEYPLHCWPISWFWGPSNFWHQNW